jgi:hypothetical protein
VLFCAGIGLGKVSCCQMFNPLKHVRRADKESEGGLARYTEFNGENGYIFGCEGSQVVSTRLSGKDRLKRW